MAQLNKSTSIGDITDVYERLKSAEGGGGSKLPRVVSVGIEGQYNGDFTSDDCDVLLTSTTLNNAAATKIFQKVGSLASADYVILFYGSTIEFSATSFPSHVKSIKWINVDGATVNITNKISVPLSIEKGAIIMSASEITFNGLKDCNIDFYTESSVNCKGLFDNVIIVTRLGAVNFVLTGSSIWHKVDVSTSYQPQINIKVDTTEIVEMYNCQLWSTRTLFTPSKTSQRFILDSCKLSFDQFGGFSASYLIVRNNRFEGQSLSIKPSTSSTAYFIGNTCPSNGFIIDFTASTHCIACCNTGTTVNGSSDSSGCVVIGNYSALGFSNSGSNKNIVYGNG